MDVIEADDDVPVLRIDAGVTHERRRSRDGIMYTRASSCSGGARGSDVGAPQPGVNRSNTSGVSANNLAATCASQLRHRTTQREYAPRRSKTPCEDIGTLHQPQSCSRRSRLVDTRSKSKAVYDVGEELLVDASRDS